MKIFHLATVSVFLYLLFRLGKMNKPQNFNANDAKQAILSIKGSYGVELAEIVEKIMRWETAHFTSKQYVQTGSAGMEAGKWAHIPVGATSGVIKMHDADTSDGIDSFIIWNSVTDFAKYLAEYILRHDGNWARWYSTIPIQQEVYRDKVNTVTTHFV